MRDEFFDLVFGIFKKSAAPPEPRQDKDDEDYQLEWRNRYLRARLEYLKKKIEKRNGFVGSLETTETDLLAINEFLAGKVEELEKEFKLTK